MPLFSDVAIPYSGLRDRGLCHWLGADSEKNYLANPHPNFGPKDIEYSINTHGYRCPEFEERESFAENHQHLLVVGESHALGVGLPDNLTYASLVAQKLAVHTGQPVQHWNLSQGGASCEYVARLLPSALSVLRPNFVILNFAGPRRREYIFDDGNYLTCGEWENVAGSLHTAHRHDEVQDLHFEHAHDDSNLFSNWKMLIACQRHLMAHNVMWAIKADTRAPDTLLEYVDLTKFAPRRIRPLMKAEKYTNRPELSVARDGRHAGAGPHADIAEDIFQMFCAQYALKSTTDAPHAHQPL